MAGITGDKWMDLMDYSIEATLKHPEEFSLRTSSGRDSTRCYARKIWRFNKRTGQLTNSYFWSNVVVSDSSFKIITAYPSTGSTSACGVPMKGHPQRRWQVSVRWCTVSAIAIIGVSGCQDQSIRPTSSSSGASAPVSATEGRLVALRGDHATLVEILPNQLRLYAIEIDNDEVAPDRFLAANLVLSEDYARTATFVMTVPQHPSEVGDMDEERRLYEGSSYSFAPIPTAKAATFGQHSYVRTMADDSGRRGWSLFSDVVNVSLIFSGVEISDTELWAMAERARAYLS